ncbi:MAG: NYN domain-containing protein [bacterium]
MRYNGNIIFMQKQTHNIAFIDGQNLHMGTRSDSPVWKIDLVKFREYLAKKYNVEKAYYYLGCVDEKYQNLYEEIQNAGFILVFRKHNIVMAGKKKGNVDSDIIFGIMKKLYKKELLDKIVLVSGDGDYKMLVDFLIEEERFEKILFPNKKFASSLYKKLPSRYYDYLGNEDVRAKIKKGPLR